jgi:DNA adenine methylase
MSLKSPFPYFGGKSRVASIVWERFGDCRNYVEPFCGSAAMLLGRPHYPFVDGTRTETVNDYDCMVANFWRALQADPEAIAEHCDWPVNEADLHARHLWLVTTGKERVERLRTDPDYFDAKVAGWWCWGVCQWIGSGWCSGKSSWGGDFADGRLAHERLPHLGSDGRGVHRPSQQLPHLGSDGMGNLHEYMHALAARLRRVRVCCGDWSRVCGETPTTGRGLTGMFFDPPYADTANRDPHLYSHDSLSVAHDVREWCIANGDNTLLRICLAGYDGEHQMPASWTKVVWKASGGYAGKADAENVNAKRERLWFSPYCLKPDRLRQRTMLTD